MMISFGRLKTMRKSRASSVRPIPNIMTPSSGLITVGFTRPNTPGNVSAATADSNTSTPMYFDMYWQSFFIGVEGNRQYSLSC